MNPGYHCDYQPAVRNSRLFRRNTGFSRPAYNSAKTGIAPSTSGLYFPYPSNLYRSQYRQSPLLNNRPSYNYYPALPQVEIPSPMPFASYPPPGVTYASTISSKGLAIILIAILMLTALDLVIVRPQKMRSFVQNSISLCYQLP